MSQAEEFDQLAPAIRKGIDRCRKDYDRILDMEREWCLECPLLALCVKRDAECREENR